jgi:hypothetical protein
VQGTQYVGASNGEETLTLGGSGKSSAKASARVQDPEARKKVEDLTVQGTGDETLTLGAKGMRTSSAAASARAQGPEVQGAWESAEVIVLSSATIASAQVELSTNFLELIREAGKRDADWQATKEAVLKKSENVAEEFEVKDGLLFYENRWVTPNDSALKLRILHENHDSKVAGQFGQFKTAERMKQNFYGPKMDDDARDYVRSCDTCQRDKVSRHRRYGLLQPLEIPYRPWTSISMDFITALPESDGFTQIWVIVDRLTKMAHFIPLRVSEGSSESPVEDLAKIFAKEVWRLHGIKQSRSTAFHPQRNGQTERINEVLEAYNMPEMQ